MIKRGFVSPKLQGVSVAGVGTVLSEIPWPWYVGLDPTKTS